MPKPDRQHSTQATSHPSRRAALGPRYAEFAVKYAELNALAAALTAEVRAAAKYLSRHHGYSLTILAGVTGLHKNSLLRLWDKSWMPKPETLRRLEKLVIRAEAKRHGETFHGEQIKRGRPAKG
jgi:hypothetical protein